MRRILHQRGFFDTVAPVNFNTIATPHIGLPKYPTVLSSITTFFGPKLLSRTGEQFYAVDKWSKNGRPLLEVMSDPGTSACRFRMRVRVANAENCPSPCMHTKVAYSSKLSLASSTSAYMPTLSTT